jgi:hypothetical protein
MQPPKSLFTAAALSAALLSSTASAQAPTPDPHIASSTGGAAINTFTYDASSNGADVGSADDAGKNSPAKPQSRPDAHKYTDLGKTSVKTATVKPGEMSTEADDAGKSSPAKPQSRPDMHKYSSTSKFGKPSSATVSLGGISTKGSDAGKNTPVKGQPTKQEAKASSAQKSSVSGTTEISPMGIDSHDSRPAAGGDLGDSCQIVEVLEDSATASQSYAVGEADVRTQATASARITSDVTNPSDAQVLKGELTASLSENVSIFGLVASTGRISVAADRSAPHGSCGTVTSRNAGARIELGGATVSILREQGDALIQTSIEQVTLRDEVLLNAGPVALLVAPLVSTRADVSIEAGSLDRVGHLGMRGFLQLQSSGVVVVKVVGSKASKDAVKTGELEFDTARNLIEIHEHQAAAQGEIRLEVGVESLEDSLGTL